MTTGDRLKAWREDRHMTQDELADALEVTRRGVRFWEKDERPMDRRTRLALAAIQAGLDPLFDGPGDTA